MEARRTVDLKPKPRAGYTEVHADLCERTLVTLLRGLGPWKKGVYVIGGLVPRYLIQSRPDLTVPPYVGTMDVDLVLNLDILGEIQAYRRLEQNLKRIGFDRATNDEGRGQHFRWLMDVGAGVVVAIDLLCESVPDRQSRVVPLPGEKRLSALALPGAHLVALDCVEIKLTAELLTNGAIATETVRIANVVPFIVLKALAYEERVEEKDAHDLLYCLMYYGAGPGDVAREFVDRFARWPDTSLLYRALEILRDRFATDETGPGARKDGPVNYARFLMELGRQDLDARHRQDAAAAVEAFLNEVDLRLGDRAATRQP
jgi:hypothetical protein